MSSGRPYGSACVVPQGREPAAGRFCLRPREGRPAGRQSGCLMFAGVLSGRAGIMAAVLAIVDGRTRTAGGRSAAPDRCYVLTSPQRNESARSSVQKQSCSLAPPPIAADEIREPGPTPSLLAQSARNRTSAFTARVRSRVRVGHSAPARSFLFEPSRKPEPPQPSRPRGRSSLETGSSSTKRYPLGTRLAASRRCSPSVPR